MYGTESLRRLVRLLEYENRILKDKLKKENIPYEEINPFEETIENAEMRMRLKQVPRTESLILIATGQKIGEGFDFPRLDVLMLAAPFGAAHPLRQIVSGR